MYLVFPAKWSYAMKNDLRKNLVKQKEAADYLDLSEAIAERNAFNCECERHDLLARKMQGHDVCFAAVTRLRT